MSLEQHQHNGRSTTTQADIFLFGMHKHLLQGTSTKSTDACNNNCHSITARSKVTENTPLNKLGFPNGIIAQLLRLYKVYLEHQYRRSHTYKTQHLRQSSISLWYWSCLSARLASHKLEKRPAQTNKSYHLQVVVFLTHSKHTAYGSIANWPIHSSILNTYLAGGLQLYYFNKYRRKLQQKLKISHHRHTNWFDDLTLSVNILQHLPTVKESLCPRNGNIKWWNLQNART